MLQAADHLDQAKQALQQANVNTQLYLESLQRELLLKGVFPKQNRAQSYSYELAFSALVHIAADQDEPIVIENKVLNNGPRYGMPTQLRSSFEAMTEAKLLLADASGVDGCTVYLPTLALKSLCHRLQERLGMEVAA